MTRAIERSVGLIVGVLMMIPWGEPPALAATQEILGKQFLVKDPRPVGHPSGVDATKRKVVVSGKEKNTGNTVVGDPIANGATLEIIANGAFPSSQMVIIPPGLIGGVPGWTAVPGGFKWSNPTSTGAAGIPVKRAQIRVTPSGVFLLKVQMKGKLSGPGVLVAPPAAGTDGGMIFTIGGGDTYCLRFGGPAGGKVKNSSATGPTPFLKSFKITSTRGFPTRELGCPSASTCSLVTTWGTDGDGIGEFSNPSGVAVLPGVGVYVSDDGNDRMQLFDPSGTFISQWGSSGSLPGEFKGPSGVAVDGASLSVYVVDAGNDRIQKFDSTGTSLLAAWGSKCRIGNGTGCVDPDGGGPLALGDGQFDTPSAVTVDAAGNVYVTDDRNDRVQKFDSTGTFLTKWGMTGTATGEFDRPMGIAADGAGSIYVADSRNNRIQKFDSTGTFLGEWGTECRLVGGGSGCVDPDGAGPLEYGDGQLSNPTAVTADGAGNVYVADDRNGRIQKFDSTGAFLGKWGTEGDGPGQFERPTGLSVDGTGNIYVTDRADRVQKFAPSCP